MPLPAHIQISVDAVGGVDSEEGQKMLALLTAAEEESAAALPAPEKKPKPAELPAPEQTDDDLIGRELVGMFTQIKEEQSGEPVPDRPTE